MKGFTEMARQPGGSSGDVARDDSDPIVGRPSNGLSPLLFTGLLAVLAIALFLYLNTHRLERTSSLITPAYAEAAPVPAPPPSLELPKPPQPVPAAIAPPPQPAPSTTMPQMAKDPNVNLKAPSVVVDLLPATELATPKPATGDKTINGQSSLNPNEQFAARASEASPESSVATQLANLPTLIAQGSTIPAVLETAINSDLPGYTRALVSRDVRGFDGKTVLIPRGSRVIGQYKNAMSLGQARVFIIWTRIIRPDGVSIQIGSPGSDSLGRGGVTGDVNSHFFARFGGSVLLSLLNIAGAAVTGVPSTQISIGSPQSAVGAAANVSTPDGQIPPTINVPQGAPINIFVARDLDFSAVKRLPSEP